MKDSQEVISTEIKKKKMRGLWTDCLAYFYVFFCYFSLAHISVIIEIYILYHSQCGKAVIRRSRDTVSNRNATQLRIENSGHLRNIYLYCML